MDCQVDIATDEAATRAAVTVYEKRTRRAVYKPLPLCRKSCGEYVTRKVEDGNGGHHLASSTIMPHSLH